MSFSATDAAFEGFRLARRAPLAILWWALAYLVMGAAVFAVAGASLVNMMATAEQLNQAADPTPEQLIPLFQNYAAVMAWVLPLGLVFSAVLSAAVARGVLHPSQKAFGYLRLGGDELRVLVVTIVLGVLFGLLGALLATAVGAIAGLAGSLGQPALSLVVALAIIIALAIFVWLAIRLSLAAPMTVAERRIAIFDSFSATRGRFWSLLGMAVIALVMSIIVSLLGGLILQAVSLMTGGFSGPAELAGQEGLTAALREMWPAIAVWAVGNSILSALQLGIMYAPFAAAYRGIKEG